MRTLGSTSCALSIVIALTACGELGKAVDKLEEMDKEMAGESDTPPAPTTAEPPAPTVPEPPVPAPTPAPAPVEVAQPEVAPAPVETPKPAPTQTTSKTTSTKTETKSETKPEPVKPAPLKPEPVKPEVVKPEPVKPEPVKPEVAKPEPVKPEPAPAKAKTVIPQSKRVRVEAPKRVQELLDLDGRMQPWLNNTMKVIEQCYADVLKDNDKAAGTIVFVLEMHKNSRPDADISALPPALSGIVACATGKLMRAARMPLFTGNEGEKHTVRVKFTP